jgi:hypothetical protein
MYATQLQITARTAWATWYEISDIATRYTEAAIDWYIATFFSEAANARYKWIGEMLGCVLALAYLYGQRWADRLVNECLNTAPAPVAEVAESESAIVLDVKPGYPIIVHRAQGEVMAAPKAPAKEPTLAQLRKHCIEHNKSLPAGDPRRIARAGHLNRAQALAALGRI